MCVGLGLWGIEELLLAGSCRVLGLSRGSLGRLWDGGGCSGFNSLLLLARLRDAPESLGRATEQLGEARARAALGLLDIFCLRCWLGLGALAQVED